VARFRAILPRLSTSTRAKAPSPSPLATSPRWGATLALGGVNPLTGERVVQEETCRHVLAVMTTAGLYENSGDWLYDVGLPWKSGIGGGIITIAPGKGGLATFAPPLDEAGNSVRGQLAARFLSRALGLDIFMSRADHQRTDT
jgi:glutaminase